MPWSGAWANDAQHLFRLLREAVPSAAPEPATGEGHTAQSHATSAECQFCPLCQGLAIIRREGPDVLDRISELAAGLAATLRATAPVPDERAAGDAWASSTDRVTDPVTGPLTGPVAQPEPDQPEPAPEVAQPGPPIQPLVRIEIAD